MSNEAFDHVICSVHIKALKTIIWKKILSFPITEKFEIDAKDPEVTVLAESVLSEGNRTPKSNSIAGERKRKIGSKDK